MTVRISGVEDLMASIQQGGAKAVKGVYEEMHRAAEDMKDLAREYAPVDKGDLEKAIKVRQEGGDRDWTGRFTRKSVEVYVDQNVPSSNGDGHTTADYAWEMHEHLAPYGGYNLGPKSAAKMYSTGKLVGGGYLERAVDEISETLMDRLIRKSKAVF